MASAAAASATSATGVVATTGGGTRAGVKRGRCLSEASTPMSTPAYSGNAHVLSVKRTRRISSAPADMSLLLRSDIHGNVRFESRLSVLSSLAMDAIGASNLLRVLGCDNTALLALLDLNACRANVAAILADFDARAVPLTALNIRAHMYTMNEKIAVLRSFAVLYGEFADMCDVLRHVVVNVFQQDTAVSVCVLTGGGVRDVLLAEWCRCYAFCQNATSTPNLVVLRTESGNMFLLPFAA